MTSKKTNLEAYVLLTPALLLFGVFILYPFVFGLGISFFKWDGFNPMRLVFFDNYIKALKDPVFMAAVGHNVQYAVGSVTGKILLSFLIALLLNRRIGGQTFFRAIFFAPVVLSFVAVGALWQRLYDPILGIINLFLQGIDVIREPIQFLADPRLALWSLVLVDIWKWTGYHVVLFLAGLQTIPEDLYEAGSIDGANWWQGLIYITIPQLRSITLLNITIALMGAFSVFDLVYVMTKGGPYQSTNVILTYMYEKTFASSSSNFGFGSSIAFLMFIIILGITIVQTKRMSKANS
jgi:ABC-type sugar transport system permease subunit